jgi:hypothetical protein
LLATIRRVSGMTREQVNRRVQMRGIWRFYMDGDMRWRWQRLSVSKAVIAESNVAFSDYAQCVEDAQGDGYVPLPSQSKLRPRLGEHSLVDSAYSARLSAAEPRRRAAVHATRPGSEPA